VLASACASSPPPLPPRRVAFAPQPLPPPAPAAPDVDRPAEPPIIHERYAHWTLLADFAAVVPLTYWMFRPDDAYLAVPALLLTPAIHTLHGESGNALISLVLRGAMIGGVYLAGRSAEAECDRDADLVCLPFGSIMIGALAMTLPITIDAVFLARATRRAEGWQGLPVQPTIGVSADGRTWLSVGGRF
jgi:hypothetical protein